MRQVGRPRPNFAARCWPDGPPQYDVTGVPLCSPDAVNPSDGRKSFPSGVLPCRPCTLETALRCMLCLVRSLSLHAECRTSPPL